MGIGEQGLVLKVKMHLKCTQKRNGRSKGPASREKKSFTASGLTKITLPHGCTAETDTHIFAAADDGFSRSENEYTISYLWPLTRRL
jgi:hypothetical protein